MIQGADTEGGRIELHCHLDGSVRPSTIEDLAREQGLELPGPAAELARAPASCSSLVEYIGAIDIALDVLQVPEALERAARELVEDWRSDGIVHGEVRFAPQLHQRQGLSLDEVLGAVLRGLGQGRDETGLSIAVIVCCLRHQSPEVSDAVADLAVRRADAVAALDLAGPEEGFPGTPHQGAFRRAREAGLRITVHAGEAAGPESVREALDVLGAERIGHGVRAVRDPALVEHLADRQIALECCPTSNVQTGAVTRLEDHPLDRLRRAGVPVTISTDDRTVSATTLTRELDLVTRAFGWTASDHRACQQNAARASFASVERRRQLVAQLESD